MNAIEQCKSLPATEALERDIAQQRLPQAYGHSRSSSLKDTLEKSRKKRSFDMADLLEATAPVELAIAFPTIEWSLDDEINDMDVESLEVSSYFPSASCSSPALGKRSRFTCLVRSKSLKSSLCSLVRRSSSHSLVKRSEGSWGQFVCNEEVMFSSVSRSGSDYGLCEQVFQTRSSRMPQRA
jgi:hypothetical protein